MNDQDNKKPRSSEALIPEEDYYVDEDGNWVFTSTYHLKRGYCCQNGCRHCPFREK